MGEVISFKRMMFVGAFGDDSAGGYKFASDIDQIGQVFDRNLMNNTEVYVFEQQHVTTAKYGSMWVSRVCIKTPSGLSSMWVPTSCLQEITQ